MTKLINCPRCGNRYDLNTGVCPRCGNVLPQHYAETAAAPSAMPAPAMPAPAMPAPAMPAPAMPAPAMPAPAMPAPAMPAPSEIDIPVQPSKAGSSVSHALPVWMWITAAVCAVLLVALLLTRSFFLPHSEEDEPEGVQTSRAATVELYRV